MTKNVCLLNMALSYTTGKPMERVFQKVRKKFDLPNSFPAPPPKICPRLKKKQK